GDRKSDDDECDDQPHHPVRNFQERKNLRRNLNEQPSNNGIRDRNFVNVAPLQLGEEIVLIHFDAVADLNCEAGTIFSASASKRGWPCRGASAGSIRIAAMLLPSRSR